MKSQGCHRTAVISCSCFTTLIGPVLSRQHTNTNNDANELTDDQDIERIYLKCKVC